MEILEYPKIQTLFKRDKNTFAVTDELLYPEFGLIKEWYVTEKIHGQNIRIHWDGETVTVAARTSLNPKDVPGDLRQYIEERFTPEKMLGDFSPGTTFFGEGCGAGINGGGNYSATKKFVLFDINIANFWLSPDAMQAIARNLSIDYVPVRYDCEDLDDIVDLVRPGFSSILGSHSSAEGIVARTVPDLMTRYGTRLMFKLKTCDFKAGKR